MDIQSIVQDERRKKFLIIAGVALFIVVGIVIFFLTRSSTSSTQEDSQAQLLEDFAKLSPRSGIATSTLSLMPKIALLADRTTVDPGQPVKISWKASNAESCVDINGDTLELTGSKSVLPKEPYTFDILCTGPEGTDLQSITIAVTGFPSIALYAYPNEVKSGEQSVISWDATNADRCVDSAGKVLRLSGGLSVSPKSSYTFSMSCTGPKGTTRKSVTVSIARPLATGTTGGMTTGGTTEGTISGGTSDTGLDPWAAISSFFGGSGIGTSQKITLEVPTSVEEGSTARVKWTLKNVDPLGCVFSNTVPNSWLKPLYPSSGSVVSSPLYETQTITISCTKGTENVQKSAEITVVPKPLPPDPNFTSPLKADAEYVATGKSVNLSWAAKGATRCSLIKNGATSPFKSFPGGTGSVPHSEYTKGEYSYTLECKNTNNVTVKSGPISVSFIDCSFINGFGKTLDEINKRVDGEVILDTRPGTNYGKPICTHTYGDPSGNGTADDFAKIFYDTTPRVKIIDYKDGDDGTSFCSYTHYQKIDVPDMGVQTVDLIDKKYHRNWKKLSSTAEFLNYPPYSISEKDGGMNWVSFLDSSSNRSIDGDHFRFSNTAPTLLNFHGGNHNWDSMMGWLSSYVWWPYQRQKYGATMPQGTFAYMNSLTCLVVE